MRADLSATVWRACKDKSNKENLRQTFRRQQVLPLPLCIALYLHGLHSETMPQNIYIVGAQCTGKTTLVAALSSHFTCSSISPTTTPAPLIFTEVARTVLRKHNFIASDITSSPSKALLFQQLILEAQYATEKKAEASQWFISDRSGFDPIVYTRRYVGEEEARSLTRMEIWGEMKERMGQSLVVVCEAGADWLVDDGVRLMPEDRNDWVAFHELFCESLKDEGLDYVVLPCEVKDLAERVRFVLDRWRGIS